MKSLVSSLPTVARALMLVVALAAIIPALPAAEANPSPKQSTAKFEVSWSRLRTPEMEVTQAQLNLLMNRYKSGAATKEELANLEYQFQRAERERPYRLSLTSKGGTVRELLSILSAGSEAKLTLINAGEAADLEIVLPAFELNNASWNMVIEVLSNFVATRGLILKIAGSDGPTLDASGSVVCVMRRADSAEGRRSPETRFESYQLSEYLDTNQTVDVIVDAIQTAWKLNPANDPDALRVKFHPGTKLLLVTGSANATLVATQVIKGLHKVAVQK